MDREEILLEGRLSSLRHQPQDTLPMGTQEEDHLPPHSERLPLPDRSRLSKAQETHAMRLRGSGRVYQHGNYWWIDFTFRGKRQRERVAPLGNNKPERKAQERHAHAILSKRLSEVAENRFLDVKRECQITFSQLCDKYLDWVAGEHKNPKTAYYYVRNLKAFFGNPLISEISREDVKRYQKHRQAADSTIIHELTALRQMYNLAIIDWEHPDDKRQYLYAGANPASHFNRSKKLKPSDRKRWLDKGELVRLISAISERRATETNQRDKKALTSLLSYVLFAVTTGCRKGEIRKLRHGSKDIHFGALDRMIDYVVLRDTKNGDDRRVPLNRISASILAKPFDFNYDPRKLFDNMCAQANIEDVTFHDLRRTFATYLNALGVNGFVISELLGHRVGTVTGIYARVPGETLREAVLKLENYLMELVPSGFYGTVRAQSEISGNSNMTEVVVR